MQPDLPRPLPPPTRALNLARPDIGVKAAKETVRRAQTASQHSLRPPSMTHDPPSLIASMPLLPPLPRSATWRCCPSRMLN